MKQRIDLSIVIPTYNSMPSLQYVLESINKQQGTSYEIIVIDKFSRDGTVKVAQRYGAKVYQLNCERTKAVNYGVKKACGRYVYYLGSDYVLLGSNHLFNIVVQMDRENGDAGIVTNLVDYRKSFWSRVRFIEKLAYYMDPVMEAARVFRRDIFLKIGGYKEDMVAYEEHELHNRLISLGYKVIRIKGAIEFHINEPKSLRDVAKKFYYYGTTSVDAFLKSHGRYAQQVINPFRAGLIYRFHWLTRIDPLASTFGLTLYQLCKYMAGLAGFLRKKLY